MRLNGWHRLWIVLSVLWLMVLTGLAIMDFPTKPTKPTKPPTKEYEEFISKYRRDSPNKIISPSPTTKPWLKYRRDSPNKIISPEDFDKYSDSGIFRYERYRKELAEFPKKRTKFIRLHVILWLAPVLGSYALGWAIGWVIRGFKSKKKGAK